MNNLCCMCRQSVYTRRFEEHATELTKLHYIAINICKYSKQRALSMAFSFSNRSPQIFAGAFAIQEILPYDLANRVKLYLVHGFTDACYKHGLAL